MAYNAAVTVAFDLATQSIIITDASTGSDPAITGATISLVKVDGTLLGGSTIAWAIPLSTPKTIQLLDKDYSLNVSVVVTSSAPDPPPSSYTTSVIATSTEYTNEFIYELNQEVAGQPTLLNDKDFYENWNKLQTEADNAVLSTQYDDQGNAEAALQRAQYIMNNRNLFF